MKVVCFITDDAHPGFSKWFEPSCQYQKLDLVVLKYDGRYTSHKLKDLALLKYIDKRNEDEIVFFTDAYDVMLLAGETEIIEKYRRFKAPMVFSAEINCWPDTGLGKKYPKDTETTFFRYLNSGGFIGRVGYVKRLIEKYYHSTAIDHEKYGWSNQYTWNQIFLNEKEIKLDHNGEIFYTLSSSLSISGRFANNIMSSIKEQALTEDKKRLSDELVFENFRLTSKLTGTRPCQLHFTSPTTKHLMETNFFTPLCPWIKQ